MGKNTEQARGRFKQAIGDISGNKGLKRRGKAEERSGKAKAVVEKITDRVEQTVDDATDH